MDFEALPDEIKALVTIQRHITIVQKYLTRLSNRLAERALEHDLSKLSKDEFAGFVEINQIARLHPYGSPEYKASLAGNKTIDLHFSRNSHHPEYHPNGIDDMGLFDLIEMVIDWGAASLTYGQTNLQDSLVIQQKRFNLDDKMMWLINLIIEELE